MQLQSVYGDIQAAGAEVLSVVVASLEAVNGMCESVKLSFPVLSDADHRVSEAYEVYNLLGDGWAAPAVFIIDKDGRVVWSQIGQRPYALVAGADVLQHLP